MSDKNYQAARKAAEKAIKKRNEFYEHLAIYVVVNVMLIAAFGWQFWMVFVVFGWGIGVVTHGMEVFANDPNRKERAIQREMQKMGYAASPDSYEVEKPKRDKAVQLGDDGELIYEDEAVEEEADRSRNRNRRRE